jgi:hypothetical protein
MSEEDKVPPFLNPRVPRLTVSFEWDHAAGLFYAHLSNGTRIPVKREHITGRLENALTLFRNGVAAQAEGRTYVPKEPKGDFGAAIQAALAAGRVTRVSRTGKVEISLEELGL